MLRKLARVTLNALTALSLLLLLGTLAAWAWSHRQGETVTWTVRRQEAVLDGRPALVWSALKIQSSSGGLQVSTLRFATADSGWMGYYQAKPVLFRDRFLQPYDLPIKGNPDDPDGLGGFAIYSQVTKSPDGPPDAESTIVTPYWFLALLLAVVPLRRGIRFAKQRRRQRRARTGRCPACGYDLRATPGRCPECGKVPALDEPSI